MELWNGKAPNKNKKTNNSNNSNNSNYNNVKVSQPISQGQGQAQGQNYTDGTAINSLPTYDMTQSNSQQLPNYDAMYKQDTTPLVGAASPEGMMTLEPAAANSVLGGGAFGSW
jgi:hypothetical protein